LSDKNQAEKEKNMPSITSVLSGSLNNDPLSSVRQMNIPESFRNIMNEVLSSVLADSNALSADSMPVNGAIDPCNSELSDLSGCSHDEDGSLTPMIFSSDRMLYLMEQFNTLKTEWDSLTDQAAADETGMPFTESDSGTETDTEQTATSIGTTIPEDSRKEVNYGRFGFDPNIGSILYYSSEGIRLTQSSLDAPGILDNIKKFKMDKQDLAGLAEAMEEAGLSCQTGTLDFGTGSDHGIDLRDLAAGGLGTSYDWRRLSRPIDPEWDGPDVLDRYQRYADEYSDLKLLGQSEPCQVSDLIQNDISLRTNNPNEILGSGSWQWSYPEAKFINRAEQGNCLYDPDREAFNSNKLEDWNDKTYYSHTGTPINLNGWTPALFDLYEKMRYDAENHPDPQMRTPIFFNRDGSEAFADARQAMKQWLAEQEARVRS
jgi:hypothetical protein